MESTLNYLIFVLTVASYHKMSCKSVNLLSNKRNQNMHRYHYATTVLLMGNATELTK